MTKRAVQRGMIFLFVMSASVLLGNGTSPGDAPYKNIFNKKDESASRAPEPCQEGPDGICLMPQSDPFPNEVTSEMAEVIMQEYPMIARAVKKLHDSDAEDKPTEIFLMGKPGVGKTTMAAAIALTLKRKTIFLKSTSLAGNEMQNSGIEAIKKLIGVVFKDMQTCDDNYVIIIDELAPLTAAFKDDRHPHMQLPITHLWLTLDDLRRTGRVLVIATANEERDIPDQIRSRAKRNTFEIKDMTPIYRQKTLQMLLKNRHTLSDEEVKKLSERMHKQGYNVREMQDVVLDAFDLAYHKGIKNVDKSCANRAFEVYVKRNTKGWVDSFNDFCDKNRQVLTNLGQMSLVFTGVVVAGPIVAPYVITFVKDAAATQAGVLIVSATKLAAGTTVQMLLASPGVILLGCYKGAEVYVERSLIEAFAEIRDIPIEEAREAFFESVSQMSGAEKAVFYSVATFSAEDGIGKNALINSFVGAKNDKN